MLSLEGHCHPQQLWEVQCYPTEQGQGDNNPTEHGQEEMLKHCHITPHHNTKGICVCACVHVLCMLLQKEVGCQEYIWMMICMCITKRIRVCNGCTCHMQMACDILPPTEVQNAKPGVTCPLYVICYTNVDIPIAWVEMPWLMTSTYLVCNEHFCVALGDIGFTTDLNINSAKVNIVLRRVL